MPHKSGGRTWPRRQPDILVSDDVEYQRLPVTSINDDAVPLLMHSTPTRCPKANLATRVDPDPALVISQRRQQMGHKTLRHVLHCYLSGLEIEKQITLHSLRRTFATAVFRKTTDIQVVQWLMGHANIQTTTIYLHLNDDVLYGAMDQL